MNDAILPDAAAIHHGLLTVDTHIDIPWPTGPDPFTDGPRKVDLPKMRRGGLAAGCFVAYVPQAARTIANEEAAFARATGMLRAIRAMAEGAPGLPAVLTLRAAEVREARAAGRLAIIPAVENGFAIGTDLARLRELAALGARYMTLTHNGHNAIADSANPRADLGERAAEHGGLSGFGRRVVAEMNRLGMLVDVAHVSRLAMLDAAEASRTPVFSSHSCVAALCDHARNMDNGQLDMLREVGGVIQITAVSAFLRPNARPEAVTVADFADHVDYAVRRIGIEHVGISSDFDGGGGFSDWNDAGDCPNITAELLRRGYDRAALELLWGGNFLRLLRIAEERAG
ncbi:MAG: dipeptidase [Rhodospirillales bacterium]|nr:dipeptidase [Rhodospirillales bacterium]